MCIWLKKEEVEILGDSGDIYMCRVPLVARNDFPSQRVDQAEQGQSEAFGTNRLTLHRRIHHLSTDTVLAKSKCKPQGMVRAFRFCSEYCCESRETAYRGCKQLPGDKV